MSTMLSGLCVVAVAALVSWLRRDAIFRARRDPRDTIAVSAATGALVEAAVAALIALHLLGYVLSGLAVLLTIGAIGNFAPMLLRWSK